MQRVLNTFMLHGRPLEEICRIAEKSHCQGLSIEVQQLHHPQLEALLRKHHLRLTGVGAVFLPLDQEDLSGLEDTARTAAAHGARVVFCILCSGAVPSGQLWTRARNMCRRLEALGRKYRISICLEPLSGSMRDISPLCDPETLAQLCRGLDPRWFGWTMDLCHCAQMPVEAALFEELTPYLHSVHLADLPEEQPDQNDRRFPGEGALPLHRLFARLRGLGFHGPVELEVISPAVHAMADDELAARIAGSFLCMGNCFVAGELAVHHFLGGEVDLTMLGGSAGMVSTQLQALGVQPVLLGLCGADDAGFRLRREARAIAAEVVCQPGRRTSVVRLDPFDPDNLDIRPGTVEPGQLSGSIEKMPDIDAYLYLPYFPGYEEPEIVSRGKKNWKRILDFGFYQWCGNYGALLDQVKKTQPGFCALLNAKHMSTDQKLRLGKACIAHGFQYAVLTDSTQPVWLVSAEACRSFPVRPAPAVRDTCGAGDCMVAGIMAKLSRGCSMDEALSFGIAVSENKVQTYGIWRGSDYGRSSNQSER